MRRWWYRVRYGVTIRTDWTGGTVLITHRTLTAEECHALARRFTRAEAPDVFTREEPEQVVELGGAVGRTASPSCRQGDHLCGGVGCYCRCHE